MKKLILLTRKINIVKFNNNFLSFFIQLIVCQYLIHNQEKDLL